jgi:hypothetical protein
MSDLIIIFLASSLPIIVIGIVWIIARAYSLRLSRIDEELRAITVMLSEISKETTLKEYIFAQDQRLRGIGDKLDTYPDTDMLQQCIQDQANQVIAFVSTHSEDSKSRITKEDLKISLQVTNELLERVLWSLRFDEDKYVEHTEENNNISKDQDKIMISKLNPQREIRKDIDNNVSMGAILEGGDDDYDAMLKYMQQSGKSGVEAQQALKAAKLMHGSS